MATAKVTINDRVIMDITDTTATAATIREGYTAYGADGEKVTGTYTGATINNQNKSVTPTESQQSVTADSGYTGLGTVTVGAISSTYVGSGIEQRDETDLTASGATVTVPSGYYAEQETKAIDSGALNSNITYNSNRPSLMNAVATVNPAGYIDSSKNISRQIVIADVLPAQSATTITPTESEQIAVSQYKWTTGEVKVGAISSTYVGSEIAQRDSTDLTASGATVTVPAGYYSTQASKSVSSGSATAPVTIIGGDDATVGRNYSSGVISLIKTVSVTPTVTAGYISTGTAGDSQIILSTQGTVVQETTYTPTTSDQTIFNSGIHYFEGAQKVAGDADLVAGNIKQGVTIFGVEGTYAGSSINNQNKTVTPTTTQQTITADSGYTGLGTVTVEAVPEVEFDDDPTITYSARAGSFRYSLGNTAGYLVAGDVGSSFMPSDVTGLTTIAEDLHITPTESQQVAATYGVMTDSGEIIVDAIPSNYIGSGVTQRSGTDLTVSGATVTVPAGYYSTQATKSVTSGSVTAPSSISGTSASISTGTNTLTLTKTVSVTPNVTTAGYISSGTAGNSSVSLTASVTVNPTPTASGATVTVPAGYYTTQTTKSVSSGSATAPASISGTTATVSTGTNTLTLTKTVSVTPSVTAGYVSSGTAGNSSVSLTANVTTKGAATITPTTSNQTIASGTYLTGTQTIAGDANLVGSNIISGKSIFGVSGTVVINKYYTGSSAPSSSLGNDGDIYLQN